MVSYWQVLLVRGAPTKIAVPRPDMILRSISIASVLVCKCDREPSFYDRTEKPGF